MSVNVVGMSIEGMTTVSYLLFAVSGALAVLAAAMFFVLDIAKCWQMVSGRRFESQKKRQKTVAANQSGTKHLGHALTEKISRSEVSAGVEKTFPLSSSEDTAPIGHGAKESTVLLECAGGEQTELLETDSLEIIQDIVYMQNTSTL